MKELFADTIQELLEAEMDHSLGYEKNDTASKDTDNRRNGHSKKTLLQLSIFFPEKVKSHLR
ncbi:MAG: transposase [Thermacetogeniaceae bacterium]